MADIREIIQRELDKRRAKNKRYSIRSFASSLGLNAAHLSRILRGDHRISKRTLDRILPGLKLDSSEVEKIRASYRRPTRRRPTPMTKAFDVEASDHLSTWVPYAIAALTSCEGFKPDAKWIAKRLNLPVSRVQACITKLVEIGFLEEKNATLVANDRYVDTRDRTEPDRIKLRGEFLSLAPRLMDQIPPQHRAYTGAVIPFDSDLLPKAVKRIEECRNDLWRMYQRSKRKDAVFHLGIVFFPLSKSTKKAKGPSWSWQKVSE